MDRGIEIRGGAGEFEATVIAVVIDRIAKEEEAALHGRGRPETSLPAWVRALAHDDPTLPQDLVWPQ